ncbi:MAG TPA: PRC-barrel domain-containing protein [Nakamurella sp.]
MINQEQARSLVGHEMLDRDGERIGEISRVFLNDRSGEPTWVTVKTGWFGRSESFVPLYRVELTGDELRAAYETATIKDSPRFAADQPLSPQDEDDLRGHYGLHDSGSSAMNNGTQPSQSGTAFGGGHQPAPGDPDGRGDETPGGRLRGDSTASFEPGAGTAGAGRAVVCPQCGGYVAQEMLDRHDDFHRSLGHPSGNYARHDVLVDESEGNARS